eukprot:959397_1
MASQFTEWDILIRRYSIPLISGIFVATFHSNIYPESYQYLFGPHNDGDKHFMFVPSFKLFGEYYLSLPFIINDCFMLFFFFLIFLLLLFFVCYLIFFTLFFFYNFFCYLLSFFCV